MMLLEEFIKGSSLLELTRQELSIKSPQTYSDQNYHYKLYCNGVISIVPKSCEADKSLVLSCAIHGNETAPIEIIDELLNKIRDGKLQLEIATLFIFGNPKAINNQTRFIDFNLNRLFNSYYKEIDSCHETQRAQQIESIMSKFFTEHDCKTKLHYDLHTAIKPSVHEKFAIVPYSKDQTTPKEQIAFLQDLGLDAVVFSNTKANTFSDHSHSNFGAHSMTVELGKVYPFGQNPTKNFSQAKKTLENLLEGSYKFKDKPLNKIKCYDIIENLIRENETFEFHFCPEIKNFEEFKLGEPIWSQDGLIHKASQDGLCILFPNDKVKFGQRAGLLIKEQTKENI